MSRRGNRFTQGPLTLLIGVAVVAFVMFLLVKPTDAPPAMLLEDVRAVPAHGGAAVFVSIRALDAPDRLVGVTSPIGDAVLMGVDSAAIPWDMPVQLSADGAHIMLSQIEGALDAGRLLPLSLNFARAGVLDVKARVDAAPSEEANPSEEHGGAHSGMHGGMHGGMTFSPPPGEPRPSLAMSVRAIENGRWLVSLEVEDFTFSADLADGPHQPGTGHAHLYVGGVKVGRVFEPTFEIEPLPAGAHTVRATLNTNDHRAYRVEGSAVTATATITVDGE